jgi:competence protein ComEA
MAWPRGAQRALLVLAAALLALGAWAGGPAARRPASTQVPDDPSLVLQLDLNRASAADLETLPGVGAALAARIVARRSAQGRFRSVDELRQVAGIGEKLIAALRPYLTVSPAP